MQFKYPAVFYFLFVLIIPIVVHLFQLQKFKKIAFTNVQFLQKISLETRKSSRLKKLLLLATRMLCFLALLFTFSQPYFGDKKAEVENLLIGHFSQRYRNLDELLVETKETFKNAYLAESGLVLDFNELSS